MQVKLAGSWDDFGGHRRSSSIWQNGASGRPLHGTRGILVRLDTFGMLGLRTVVGDGLGGLVELTSAISPAGDPAGPHFLVDRAG